MSKDQILNFIFPIVVMIFVLIIKMNKKGNGVNTVYLVRKNQSNPMINFYIMLGATIAVAMLALLLLESTTLNPILITTTLLVVQMAIFFVYKRFYKQ